MNIEPTGSTLGATITGVDLSRPLSGRDFASLLRALGDQGVLRFPDQPIDAAALKRFSERFGELHIVPGVPFVEPGIPEVSILSNVVENGKPVGIPDAGQDWHTDMTYNGVVGFVNVLVALKVPVRGRRALGATEFTNTQAAYEALPSDIKVRLANATAVHNLEKFWEHMRREKGSARPAFSEAQRREKPPVEHPVFPTHPITGRKVIYVNPGFTERINGMSAAESDGMLDYLFDHVLKPEHRYTHEWRVGDVLLWDHIGTWHRAIADYGRDEHRLMKRCQVMADRIFDADFVRGALAA